MACERGDFLRRAPIYHLTPAALTFPSLDSPKAERAGNSSLGQATRCSLSLRGWVCYAFVAIRALQSLPGGTNLDMIIAATHFLLSLRSWVGYMHTRHDTCRYPLPAILQGGASYMNSK